MTMPTDSSGTSLKASKISCGGYSTVVLMEDGSIFSCGSNYSGELGVGTSETNRNVLVKMTSWPIDSSGISLKASHISCGDAHTVVLMTDGTIYSTGFNYYGQLGINSTSNSNVLVEMINLPTDSSGNPTTPSKISCGSNHTGILMTDDTVYVCGSNLKGQLGIGTSDYNAYTTLTQMTILSTDSSGNQKTVSQIYCRNEHTIVLMSDDTVYACGSNYSGELGVGTSETNRNVLVQMRKSST
jgi:alpha-tubulin suppressor-like RCC1 family protein